MNIIPHILNANGGLTLYIKDINDIFNNTINKIAKKIPISNIDIVFEDNPYNIIPEIGIGAQTQSPSLIYISLDSNQPQFKKVLNEHLEQILIHEIHHCIRWKRMGYGTTLLEAIISEGLADHFDIEISNKKPEPWSVALNKNQIRYYLKKAKKEFNNKKYDYSAWFFGGSKESIPRWTGYSLGFYLVDEYLKKHPHKKPSHIYNLKASEFINL